MRDIDRLISIWPHVEGVTQLLYWLWVFMQKGRTFWNISVLGIWASCSHLLAQAQWEVLMDVVVLKLLGIKTIYQSPLILYTTVGFKSEDIVGWIVLVVLSLINCWERLIFLGWCDQSSFQLGKPPSFEFHANHLVVLVKTTPNILDIIQIEIIFALLGKFSF